MNKLVLIIAGCALAGCATEGGRSPVGANEIIPSSDQRAAYSLLTALYHPDQSPDKVVVDAAPGKVFDRSSNRQLKARLIHLRAEKSRFQFSLESRGSADGPAPSYYLKGNFPPSSGHIKMVSVSAYQPRKHLIITVRQERDGTRIFDCLWLKTSQQDSFRLGRGGRIFRFFDTMINSA